MKPEELKLLELAAKALCYEVDFFPSSRCDLVTEKSVGDIIKMDWNPLKDDGDALRLAVKLRIDLDMYKDSIQCKRSSCFDDFDDFDWVGEDFELDELAATRRAIVRAAAEIGEKNGD